MTKKDYSKIQRSLGVIERIALSLEGVHYDVVFQEISAIEEILEKEIKEEAE